MRLLSVQMGTISFWFASKQVRVFRTEKCMPQKDFPLWWGLPWMFWLIVKRQVNVSSIDGALCAMAADVAWMRWASRKIFSKRGLKSQGCLANQMWLRDWSHGKPSKGMWNAKGADSESVSPLVQGLDLPLKLNR